MANRKRVHIDDGRKKFDPATDLICQSLRSVAQAKKPQFPYVGEIEFVGSSHLAVFMRKIDPLIQSENFEKLRRYVIDLLNNKGNFEDVAALIRGCPLPYRDQIQRYCGDLFPSRIIL